MEKIFQNKVVLITGGSFGIGAATAVAFAKRGAKVVIADYQEDPEQKTLNEVKAEGAEAVFVQCDVSRQEDVESAVKTIVDRYGSLDFAFNNAGIEGDQASIEACSEENFDRTIAVNLKGVWLCMKYELLQMTKQGGGVIVNNSSVAGLKGFKGLPAYVASKHGVIGLTKAAAIEHAAAGIRVNAICPGVIRTAMIDRVTGGKQEVEQQYVAMEPVGRMGTPGEIAEAVVYLCSEGASFTTGTAIPIDGGLMAG